MEAQKKVLIVDDEEDLTWSLSKNLTRDKELYHLACVNSAEEALHVLAKTPIDLVVSDIKMPGMSGLDLLLEIKKTYPKCQVIIMTAFGSADIQKEAVSRGSLYYIEKPFEVEDLRKIIHKAVLDKKSVDTSAADFNLYDLIQMSILGRMHGVLFVSKDGKQGQVFFRDGSIVHAESEKSKGDEAFYQIMKMEDGKFEFRKGMDPPAKTIDATWQELMSEALSRKDDDPEDQIDEKQADTKPDKYIEILGQFTAVNGVAQIVVTMADGAIVGEIKNEKVKDTKVFLENSETTSMVSASVDFLSRAASQSEDRAFSQMILEYEGRTLFMLALAEQKGFAILACSPNVNLGGIRLVIKKHRDDLDAMITERDM